MIEFVTKHILKNRKKKYVLTGFLVTFDRLNKGRIYPYPPIEDKFKT